MSDFDEWFASRAARINYLLDKLEPYMDEYFHKENGKIRIDIEKMKRDAPENNFLAATTPIMFKDPDENWRKKK